MSTFKGLLQRDEQEQDRVKQNNRILDRYAADTKQCRTLTPGSDMSAVV